MRLQSIHITNFKGIKDLKIDDIGDELDIFGANGTGKTSVYDAVKWCLTGKDSLDRTDSGKGSFGVHPQYTRGPDKGKVIPKLAVSVIVKMGGHEFRRELHFQAPKTRCWYDGVTINVTEYQARVNAAIPLKRLKILTDVHHVCKNMEWQDRRRLLLEIAGNLPKPHGFDTLFEAAEGRTLDHFKQYLRERINGKAPTKGLKEEKDDINVRIDEIQRQNAEYVQPDDASLGSRRMQLEGEIRASDEQRQNLLNQETERNQQQEQLNALIVRRTQRESLLANDTSNIRPLLNERSQIQQRTQKFESDIRQAQWNLGEKKRLISDSGTSVEQMQTRLGQCREEYQQIAQPIEPPKVESEICPTCGQALPAEMMESIRQKAQQEYQQKLIDQKNELQVVTQRGNDLSDQITRLKADREKLQADAQNLQSEINAMVADQGTYAQTSDQRLKEIEQLIQSDVKPDPKQDYDWKQIQAEIDAITIGEPVSEQLRIIEEQRAELSNELNRINATLARADQVKESAQRIQELEQREVEIGVEITKLEGWLADIDRYKQVESELITAAVNSKFEYVDWKLFRILQNGNIDHCCVPMLNGIEYKDISGGQEIFVGLDIIRTLNVHYEQVDQRKYGLFLFVDEAGNYTLPLEAPRQVIRLIARKSQKTLKVG
jgi:DNA repair exonuclease SbcCD ATPase subunit